MKNKNIDIHEIAEKIAWSPFQWVLVIGDIVSGCRVNRKKQILELIKDHKDIFSNKTHLFDYFIEEDYAKVADTIFGTVWDGVSFLDDKREEQKKARKEYAAIFYEKKNANIENANPNISDLLQAFPGIILTICQDEMLEACWENKRSMSVDERIWTPKDFSSSIMWNRWVEIRNELDALTFKSVNPKYSEPRLLVKLYGNRKKPSQMLLSSKDFDLFYPKSETETDAKKFLLEIFQNRNIIFWGADTYLMERGKLFASGIENLLKKQTDESVERYIFLEEDSTKIKWKDYHMTGVFISNDKENKIKQLSELIIQKRDDIWKNKENIADTSDNEDNDNDVLSPTDAKQLFWELYIRRPKHIISEYEERIIEKIISDGGWDRKNIYLLSMVANNQADFYDVYQVISDAKKHSVKDRKIKKCTYNQDVLYDILKSRLGNKSKILFHFLAGYGAGFPMGFFKLLSDNEEELREWKKAGFQLTNSGIYIQRKQRKYVQKHMEYADLIMKTTQIYFNKEKVKRILKELEPQLDDSYFYPFDEKYFTVTRNEEISETVNALFVKMLRNLLDILKDKREGYNRIRSLLETEINNIIKIIMKLKNEELDFKIELLYYLLCEIEVSLEDDENHSIKDYITEIMNDLQIDTKDDLEKKQRYYSNKIRVILSQSSLLNRSCNMKDKDALNKREFDIMLGKVEEAEEVFKDYEDNIQPQKPNSDFFNLKMKLLFLKCKVYGKLIEAALFQEYDFAAKKAVQEELGDQLLSVLKETRETIEIRKEITGNDYAELLAKFYNLIGESTFRISKYYMKCYSKSRENSFLLKAIKNYEEANKYYGRALEYFKKYPDRYIIEYAGVTRNMADLCYKKPVAYDDKEDKEKCYRLLIKAYMLYRKGGDLHGVADILQSLGNAEYVFKVNEGKEGRSPLSFYDMAINLYRQLGDNWECFVTQSFREQRIGV